MRMLLKMRATDFNRSRSPRKNFRSIFQHFIPSHRWKKCCISYLKTGRSRTISWRNEYENIYKILLKIILAPVSLMLLPEGIFFLLRVMLCIVDLFLKTVMKLESFVIGIAVWLLILCAISTIANGAWRQLGILAILFLCIMAFMFAELLLSGLIEDLCDGLRRI